MDFILLNVLCRTLRWCRCSVVEDHVANYADDGQCLIDIDGHTFKNVWFEEKGIGGPPGECTSMKNFLVRT